MERSVEELRASIVAHELVIDAVRSVVEKGKLSPAEEEHVIECLHPTSIGASEIGLLCGDIEDKLRVVGLPAKREIPALKSLVEKELNETFSFIEKLDVGCGFTGKGDQLTERDILTKVTQIQDTSTSLVAENEKLHKRGKTVSQLVKESLDPVVNSVSALKNELLENISELSQLESSALNERFKYVPNDVLERLVDDMEEEVKAEGLKNDSEEPHVDDEEPHPDEDLAAAALKLNQINEEIALKKALLETFFGDKP